MTDLVLGGEALPYAAVRVGNVPLAPAAANDIVAIAVHQDTALAGMFTLQLLNWDEQRLQVTWSDGPLFALGAEVQVTIGYRGGPSTGLVGEVTGLEPTFEASATPTVVVRGYDQRHVLMRGTNTRTFVNMTDSQIVAKIGTERGFLVEAKPTDVVYDYVLQRNQTDLAFLSERAARIDYEVALEPYDVGAARVLRFRPRRAARVGPPTVALTRDDVISFTPRLTNMGKGRDVTVRASNPANPRQPLVSDAVVSQGGGGAPGGRVGRWTVLANARTRAEADSLAAAQRSAALAWTITGSVTCIGNPRLLAGSFVELRGFGRQFSAVYPVVSATHEFDAAFGYRTTIAIRKESQ